MEDEQHRSPPALGNRAADHVAATIRAVVGAVPFVGSALAEIVTEIVPNQRIERLEKYLLFLQEEISKRDATDAERKLKTPQSVDLIEDGAYQAVRALSDERKRYIARCVADGVTSEEAEHIREKRVLNIIGQLDDEEILILDAYGTSHRDRGAKFRNLRPEPAHIGAGREVLDKDTIYKAALDKLEQLSLLRQKVSFDRDAEKKLGIKIPEFDIFTATPKGYSEITPLGRLVLEKIGLLEREF